jgi:hypothetical protein
LNVGFAAFSRTLAEGPVTATTRRLRISPKVTGHFA